jgi:hypothetical protein
MGPGLLTDEFKLLYYDYPFASARASNAWKMISRRARSVDRDRSSAAAALKLETSFRNVSLRCSSSDGFSWKPDALGVIAWAYEMMFKFF